MTAGVLKKYRLFLVVMAINLAMFLWDPLLADLSLTNSRGFMVEVLLILPPVMVLMGLLDAWAPRQLVEAHLGREAGMRGAGLAMLLGTTAAGPLYAAFPVALALGNKGARLANVVIFLGTWAAIKLPMLIIESNFLGLRFALLRLALTVPCVLAVGYLIERILPAWTVPETAGQGQDMEARHDREEKVSVPASPGIHPAGAGGKAGSRECDPQRADRADGACQAGHRGNLPDPSAA